MPNARQFIKMIDTQTVGTRWTDIVRIDVALLYIKGSPNSSAIHLKEDADVIGVSLNNSSSLLLPNIVIEKMYLSRLMKPPANQESHCFSFLLG